MKTAALLLSLFAVTLHAAEPCQTFHGRARFYSADGQLRIWHIGTHHEFMPDYRFDDPSWDRVVDRLKNGAESAGAAGNNDLFATFTVCPTEPFRQGAAQTAIVHSMRHPVIVAVPH
ncbi:hypothetical protein SAMN05421819_4049 [Bryocella elongata]|uniref:Uncharacterized protein n=1 Tax=Bryocella elongata TaxID=863522 RepID=A0A1H6BY67_9BACT|nr:hypothetical protein [Bryocella elongata]SEG65593.1 hypothetical protein SAMN05421819_4049 [Bryocella elongata]